MVWGRLTSGGYEDRVEDKLPKTNRNVDFELTLLASLVRATILPAFYVGCSICNEKETHPATLLPSLSSFTALKPTSLGYHPSPLFSVFTSNYPISHVWFFDDFTVRHRIICIKKDVVMSAVRCRCIIIGRMVHGLFHHSLLIYYNPPQQHPPIHTTAALFRTQPSTDIS